MPSGGSRVQAASSPALPLSCGPWGWGGVAGVGLTLRSKATEMGVLVLPKFSFWEHHLTSLFPLLWKKGNDNSSDSFKKDHDSCLLRFFENQMRSVRKQWETSKASDKCKRSSSLSKLLEDLKSNFSKIKKYNFGYCKRCEKQAFSDLLGWMVHWKMSIKMLDAPNQQFYL